VATLWDDKNSRELDSAGRVLVWEDFAYYDNSMFTLLTLRGHNIGTQITSDGRFFPFGHQEFNFIRHFTSTPAGYHVLPIAQLLILFWILLVIDDELDIATRATLAIFALLTPSILISFASLIVPERDVLFFLAFLALSIKRFERTQSNAWAAAAVVFAQVMMFYKETAFLLLLGFAGGRLILRCKNETAAGWNYHRLWNKESRLDLCLAASAVLFLLQYFAAMGVHGNMNYAVKHQQSLLETLIAYLKADLLAWVFMAVVVGRIYLILRQRTVPALLWDGLAFGGVAYFLAYLALRLFSAYYLAPADLIAVLYVGRFTALSWRTIARGPSQGQCFWQLPSFFRTSRCQHLVYSSERTLFARRLKSRQS